MNFNIGVKKENGFVISVPKKTEQIKATTPVVSTDKDAILQKWSNPLNVIPVRKKNPLDVQEMETQTEKTFNSFSEGWDYGVGEMMIKLYGASTVVYGSGPKKGQLKYPPNLTMKDLSNWAEDENWLNHVITNYNWITGESINEDTHPTTLNKIALAVSIAKSEGFFRNAADGESLIKSIYKDIKENYYNEKEEVSKTPKTLAESNLLQNTKDPSYLIADQLNKINNKIYEIEQQKPEKKSFVQKLTKEKPPLRSALLGPIGMASYFLTDTEKKEEIKNLKIAKFYYETFLSQLNTGGLDKLEQAAAGVKSAWIDPTKLIPLYGSVEKFVDFMDMLRIADKKKENNQELTRREESVVKKAQAMNLPIQNGFWYTVGVALGNMPTYAAEIALLRGLVANPVELATSKTIASLAPKLSEKLAISTPTIAQKVYNLSKVVKVADILAGGAGLTAGALIFAGIKTPGDVAEIATKYKKTLQDPLLGDLYKELGEFDLKKAIMQKFAVNSIEYFTEFMGDIVQKPVNYIGKTLLAKYFVKKGITLTPNFVKNIAKNIAWNGIIGEVFEEELAEMLEAPIEGRKFSNPFTTKEGRQRLAAELVTIGTFGGIMTGIPTAISKTPVVASEARDTIVSTFKNILKKRDTTDPRNFKSAEEFWEAQPNKYYHGSPNADALQKGGFDLSKAGSNSGYKGVYGTGVYLTNDVSRSKLYGKPMDIAIDPKAKLLEVDAKDVLTTLFNSETKYGDPDLIRKMVVDRGYDGVKIINNKTGAEEIAIFNPNVIKTKSQLIDIWNRERGKYRTDPVKKIINALKEARTLKKEQEVLYSKERSERLAKMVFVSKKTSGEVGFYTELGELKGEMPKVQLESVRGKITQEDVDYLFNTIKDNQVVKDQWEKVSAREGLVKLLEGKMPTNKEISLLSKIFGIEFTRSLLGADIKDDFSNVGVKITDEQEKKIIELNRQIFGDENIKITENILTPDGQEALGVYRDRMIEILDGRADAVDTFYHEAVHKYIDLFLTAQEKTDLFDYAKERYKIENIVELEEKIAEDFIKYTKNKGGLAGKIKVIFDSLIEKIKKFFKNEDIIRALYSQIMLGNNPKYVNFTFNKNSVEVKKGAELYHGTTKENAESILSDGIYKTTDETASYGKAIYLTPDYSLSKDYAGDDGVVLKISNAKDLLLYSPTIDERNDLLNLVGESQEERIREILGDKYDGFYIPDDGRGDGGEQVILYNDDPENFKPIKYYSDEKNYLPELSELSEEEQRKILDEELVKSGFSSFEFDDYDKEQNYQTFKKLFSIPGISKRKEAMSTGDADHFILTLKDLKSVKGMASDQGVSAANFIDNLFYDQSKSRDDVYNEFIERLKIENPALLYSKEVADNLGLFSLVKAESVEIRKSKEFISLPERIKNKITTFILPGTKRKERLFGLLGNKDTSVPIFREIFKKWTRSGVDTIVEPYGGAFTIGIHSLTDAVRNGLKNFYSNIFDKEKFMIVKEIKDGNAEYVKKYYNEAIKKLDNEIINVAKETQSEKVLNVLEGFKTEFPDKLIGFSDWIAYVNSIPAGARVRIYPDEYAEWQSVFQKAIDNIYPSKINDIHDAILKAYIDRIGIYSGKGQKFISNKGFRPIHENVYGHYGIFSAIDKAVETFNLLSDNGVSVILTNQDGAEMVQSLIFKDPSKVGYYFDPPYIQEVNKEKSVYYNLDSKNNFDSGANFIVAHKNAFNGKSKVALTNDINQEWIESLFQKLVNYSIFGYQEGVTPTSLIVSEDITNDILNMIKMRKEEGLDNTTKFIENFKKLLLNPTKKPIEIIEKSDKHGSIIPEGDIYSYEQLFAEKYIKERIPSGYVNKAIAYLSEAGVREEIINQLKIDNTYLENLIKVKKEKTGELSTVISQNAIDYIKNTSNKLPEEEYKRLSKINWAVNAFKGLFTGYEVPARFFRRIGEGYSNLIHKPIRLAERKAVLLERELRSKLNIFWELNKRERKQLQYYSMNKQGVKVPDNLLVDLNDKQIKAYDELKNLFAYTYPMVKKIGHETGRDIGEVKNYTPLYKSSDINNLAYGSLFELIRKDPFFASIKERAEQRAPYQFYEEDIGKVMNIWLDNASRYIAMAKATNKVRYLITSDEFKEITRKDVYQTILDWYKFTVNTPPISGGWRILKAFRHAQGLFILGLRYTVPVKQFLNVFDAWVKIGAIKMGSAAIELRKKTKMAKWVEGAPSILERQALDITFNDLNFKLEKFLRSPSVYTDQLTAKIIKLSTMRTILDRYKKKGEIINSDLFKKVDQFTDDYVDAIMGAISKAETPKFFRTELGKNWNMFMSQLNAKVGYHIQDIMGKQYKEMWEMLPGSHRAAVIKSISVLIIEAILENLITDLYWPDDPEDFAKDTLVALLSNFPSLGAIAYAFRTLKPYIPIPFFNSIYSIQQELYYIGISKKKETKLRHYSKLAWAVSGLIGVPRQIKYTIEGTTGAIDGYVMVGNEKIKIEGLDKLLLILNGKYGPEKVVNKIKDKNKEKTEEEYGGFVPLSKKGIKKIGTKL